MTELEPIDPKLALELYLDDRRSHQSKATTIAHRSRLSSFIDWLDERDIDNLNELTGRRVKEYKLHRRKESDWASSTEKSNLDTICVFVRWAEGIEAVEANLSARPVAGAQRRRECPTHRTRFGDSGEGAFSPRNVPVLLPST